VLEGGDPSLAAETILITAHHDHDGMSGSEIWHGADDNGSGTVGVVALAHAFASNARAAGGQKPKRSILFVVFASEERGFARSVLHGGASDASAGDDARDDQFRHDRSQ